MPYSDPDVSRKGSRTPGSLTVSSFQPQHPSLPQSQSPQVLTPVGGMRSALVDSLKHQRSQTSRLSETDLHQGEVSILVADNKVELRSTLFLTICHSAPLLPPSLLHLLLHATPAKAQASEVPVGKQESNNSEGGRSQNPNKVEEAHPRLPDASPIIHSQSTLDVVWLTERRTLRPKRCLSTYRALVLNSSNLRRRRDRKNTTMPLLQNYLLWPP